MPLPPRSRPRLHLLVGRASHFLTWERPYYDQHFELVGEPSPDAHLHAFGPDVLEAGATLPAASRSSYLFPGFVPRSPFFDDEVRASMVDVLTSAYDLVFVNPGPMHAILGDLAMCRPIPFSVDVDKVPFRPRSRLGSLVHVAADYPHKDSPRSQATMAATGLPFEVFPPRGSALKQAWSPATRRRLRVNKVLRTARVPYQFDVGHLRYVSHDQTIERYLAHDGFVHVAGPVPPGLDGLYTASLIEAGLSGCLVFWHDTHGLGGFLETVIEVPAEPALAAAVIREVAASADVADRSRATHEEMLATFNPARSVGERARAITAI